VQQLVGAALEMAQLALGPSEYVANLAAGVSTRALFTRTKTHGTLTVEL
jgi:hypothetical protein